MDKWDELRYYVNSFNLPEESKGLNLNKILDVKSVIKEIQKFNLLVSFGSMGVNNINRAIFTPKENARQKGHLQGMNEAFAESIRMLRDAIKYEWDSMVISKELAKLITKNNELLRNAQEILDDRKPRKIYDEIHYASKIKYFIQVWDMLFYSKEQREERYLKRTIANQ